MGDPLNWFALYNWRWRSQLMWRVFFTSAVVAVVVRTAMGWCKSGNCGHFGSGGFIIWDISGLGSKLTWFLYSSLPWAFACFQSDLIFSAQEDYSFEEMLPMAIIGVVGGLLGKFYEDGLHRNFLHQVFGLICVFLAGALFNQLTRYISYWRRNHLHKKGNRVKVVFWGTIMEITCSICLCSFLPIIYCYLMVISYPSSLPKKKKKKILADYWSMPCLPDNLIYFLWITTFKKMQSMSCFGSWFWYRMPKATWNVWELCKCKFWYWFLFLLGYF